MELYHHGIKGQKWGVRKYQNSDGTYTAAGRRRYGFGDAKEAKANYKQAYKEYNRSFNKAYFGSAAAYSPFKKHREASRKRWEDAAEKAQVVNQLHKEYKTIKKSAKINAKTDKELAKAKTSQQKIMDARSKNLSKMQNKYQNKINKTSNEAKRKSLESKMNAKISDFNEGTKTIKKAQAHYNSVIKNYGDVKLSSIGNRSYKKSAEYKDANKRYKSQKAMDKYYGKGFTTLYYATNVANGRDPGGFNKKKRG